MRILDEKSAGFISHFFGAYPGRSALMVVLLALSGIADGVSIASLVPLLEMRTSGGGEDPSTLGEVVTGFLGTVGLEPTLIVLLALIVVGICLKAGFMWLAMRQVGFTVARVTKDLRLSLIRNLLWARWSHFGDEPVGRFANSISSEAIRAGSAYRAGCVVMGAALQILVYLGLSATISLPGTVLALVGGGLFLLLLRRFMQMSRSAGEQQTIRTRSLIENLVDALQGMKPIKAMAREEQFLPLLEAETEDLYEAHRGRIIAAQGLKLFQEPAMALLLAIGIYGALNTGVLPFSSILVMAFVFYRLMQQVNNMQARYQTMVEGESAFWSLHDAIERAEAEREPARGETEPPALESSVALEDVWFRYDEDDWVLRGADIEIPANRFVSIAGASGAGKSTVADLVMGLYRPDRGRVLVDGIPLETIRLSAWRKMIGYVPQEVLLFNDTVRRNITLGDEEISEDRVVRALRAADAWDFVRQRPEGLESEIGEKGGRLSGGQRQRLAIARALVGEPTLLVLDEATTALDQKTEQAICRTLLDLRSQLTILSISHQPAMREAADVVYELEKGAVGRSHSEAEPIRG